MNFEEITRKVKKISRDTVEEVQKLNEIRQLNGKISDARLDDLSETLQAQLGIQMLSYDLRISYVCPDCRKNSDNAS